MDLLPEPGPHSDRISADAIVEAAGLEVTFGANRALAGVDLRVRPGEFVAVVGASGSGKSTLLYCLAGLETPNAGSVRLAGKPLIDLVTPGARMLDRTALALLRRDTMAFVFQAANLLPFLTVLDNVTFPRRLTGRALDTDAAKALLAELGLGQYIDADPAGLSGGEQQRVAIARALHGGQPLVLADEPTGSLDTGAARQVVDRLAGIPRDGRRSVVMVTHDPAAAARADRVVVLHDGRVVADLAGVGADALASRLLDLRRASGDAA